MWYYSEHALSEEKCDDTNDSFCEEIELACKQFPKYHTKMLLFISVGKKWRIVF
jgi:hypothetical protein